VSQPPRTPRTPAQFSVPPVPISPSKPSVLNPRAPTFVPSANLSGSSSRDENSDQEKSTLKSRVLSSFDPSSYRSESGSESPDVDDLNSEYVRLKLQITSLGRQPGSQANASFISELEAKLKEVKTNYFFDERDAEAQYQIERKAADMHALQSRLRGESTSSSETTLSAAQKIKRPLNLKPQAIPSRPAAADVFDTDEAGSEGGMFEILDSMPTTETNEKGVTVHIRDMSLPKHWSGRTPKTLLSETVAKVDRYAVISYTMVSGCSRAKRAAVCIRWEGQKTDEWDMEDVACHDTTQAEQYIATVALFSLTFPSTVGFAGASSGASGSQTFFRLLPAVFRDLWDELALTRKRSDDAINRAVWAKLRSIIEPRLELSCRVSNIQPPNTGCSPTSFPAFRQSGQTGSECSERSCLTLVLS